MVSRFGWEKRGQSDAVNAVWRKGGWEERRNEQSARKAARRRILFDAPRTGHPGGAAFYMFGDSPGIDFSAEVAAGTVSVWHFPQDLFNSITMRSLESTLFFLWGLFFSALLRCNEQRT